MCVSEIPTKCECIDFHVLMLQTCISIGTYTFHLFLLIYQAQPHAQGMAYLQKFGLVNINQVFSYTSTQTTENTFS